MPEQTSLRAGAKESTQEETSRPTSFFSSRDTVQVFAQTGELFISELPIVLNPLVRFPQRFGLKAVNLLPATPSSPDKACISQHQEMLRDGWPAYVKAFRDFTDRHRFAGKHIENLSSRRIADRGENVRAVYSPLSPHELLFSTKLVSLRLRALTLVACFCAYAWWRGRPKPWRSGEITAKPTELSVGSKGEIVHILFRYALTNNSRDEYLVPGPEAATLMKKLPGDSSLEKLGNATWDGTVRIPPKQSVNVKFDVPVDLSDYGTTMAELTSGDKNGGELADKYTQFLDKRVKEIDGSSLWTTETTIGSIYLRTRAI